MEDPFGEALAALPENDRASVRRLMAEGARNEAPRDLPEVALIFDDRYSRQARAAALRNLARRFGLRMDPGDERALAGAFLEALASRWELQGVGHKDSRRQVRPAYLASEGDEEAYTAWLLEKAHTERKTARLGPGYARRVKGLEVPYEEDLTSHADLASHADQPLERMHIAQALRSVRAVATRAQCRAVRHAWRRQALSTADRNALYHLRRRPELQALLHQLIA